eukprot:3460038-Amphidinium_carterae.1
MYEAEIYDFKSGSTEKTKDTVTTDGQERGLQDRVKLHHSSLVPNLYPEAQRTFQKMRCIPSETRSVSDDEKYARQLLLAGR